MCVKLIIVFYSTLISTVKPPSHSILFLLHLFFVMNLHSHSHLHLKPKVKWLPRIVVWQCHNLALVLALVFTAHGNARASFVTFPFFANSSKWYLMCTNGCHSLFYTKFSLACNRLTSTNAIQRYALLLREYVLVYFGWSDLVFTVAFLHGLLQFVAHYAFSVGWVVNFLLFLFSFFYFHIIACLLARSLAQWLFTHPMKCGEIFQHCT